MNRHARRSQVLKASENSALSSRVMWATGILVGVFLGFHINTFFITSRFITPERSMYEIVREAFQNPWMDAFYIAAQGGINAPKNYANDGDSIHRLFYDTVKGGDYRAREANVYRLAQVSGSIIDQCVAQGVPFGREYGGLLDNRSFGGAQVSRTF
jgi:hypothetical protein